MCATLKFTGNACFTLIADHFENITSVIHTLEAMHDVFGPADSAGYSFNKWLNDKLGPWGAILIPWLIPVLIKFGIVLCFCTCTLRGVKAVKYRWIGDTVTGQIAQYPQLHLNDPVDNASLKLHDFFSSAHIILNP